MARLENENLSLLISSTLDHFGFKPESIEFRSYCCNKVAENMTSVFKDNSPLEFCLVGSAGEGYKLTGSDIDILGVFKNTICMDEMSESAHLNILKTDFTNTAPGYTKIVFINKSRQDILHPFYFDMMYMSAEGHPYIPSSIKENFVDYLNINGPAMTAMFDMAPPFVTDMDMVFSFYYIGKEHLEKWAKRTRFYTWPEPAIVNEIYRMEGYIVPVGDKQSDFQSLQWRICYTTAEKKLIETLKVPHQKLYILLKMVARTILKPVCKAITSYVVKNVVFWIAEGTSEQLTEKLLVKLLLKSLFFIKNCLENNHLPNYMIPERNLIHGSVCGKEKQITIDFISKLLKEGGAIFERIPRLVQCMTCMVQCTDRVLQYSIWRNNVEEHVLNFIMLHNELATKYQRQHLLQLIFPWKYWYKVYQNLNILRNMKFLVYLVPELPYLLLNGKFVELCELFRARLGETMLL